MMAKTRRQPRNNRGRKVNDPINTMRKEMRLFKFINPFETGTTIKCIDNTYITSGVSNADIFFSSGAALYYNFNYLSTLTDFVEAAAMYRYFRLKKVELVIERVVDENTMLANLHGASLFIAYDPVLESTSTPYSTISRDQSAYKIDQMTFDPQVVQAPIYNVLAFDSEKTNNSVYLSTGRAGEIGGEFCLASDNATLNVSAVRLFNVKVIFHVRFAYRY